MIPSIQEFRGKPIPGLPLGANQGGRQIQPFAAQLRQLQATTAAEAQRKAAAVGGTQRPARITHEPFVAPPRVQGKAARRTTSAADGTMAVAKRQRPTSPEKKALANEIHTASSEAGVDPHVAVAIARAESSLNRTAVSPDGISVGAFQVTWDTKAEMRRKFAAGAVDRPSGTDDVAMGVAYLRYLHDLIGRGANLGRGRTLVPVQPGSERQKFVAAAYNAGEGAVARAQQKVVANGQDPTDYENIRPYLPSITRAYVDRVGRFTQQERVQPTVTS